MRRASSLSETGTSENGSMTVKPSDPPIRPGLTGLTGLTESDAAGGWNGVSAVCEVLTSERSVVWNRV